MNCTSGQAINASRESYFGCASVVPYTDHATTNICISLIELSLLHVNQKVVRNNCRTSSKLQPSRKWSGNGLEMGGKTSTIQKEGENSGSETQRKEREEIRING